MKAKIYQNKFNYSNIHIINTKKNKVNKTDFSFTSKLTESKNYLLLIDEYYKNMKKFKRNHHKVESKNNYLILIPKLVEEYNRFYLKFLNYDKHNKTFLATKLTNITNKFEFNLNKIGIHLNNKNILMVNSKELEVKINHSLTTIDFLFERKGYIEQLISIYSAK